MEDFLIACEMFATCLDLKLAVIKKQEVCATFDEIGKSDVRVTSPLMCNSTREAKSSIKQALRRKILLMRSCNIYEKILKSKACNLKNEPPSSRLKSASERFGGYLCNYRFSKKSNYLEKSFRENALDYYSKRNINSKMASNERIMSWLKLGAL